jgi:hypothetical protein
MLHLVGISTASSTMHGSMNIKFHPVRATFLVANSRKVITKLAFAIRSANAPKNIQM